MFGRSFRRVARVNSLTKASFSLLRTMHSGTMNAVLVQRFGDSSVLQVSNELQIPTPDSNQCLIKIYAAGINPVDTYIRSGVYPKLPNLPYVPGKDAAGIVVAVGDNVKNISVGSRVYTFGAETGTYAQYCLCDKARTFLLPDNVLFEQGACLGTPAFTAYRALFDRAHAQPGELIFIHGASGAVGLAAVQMACAEGIHVVGTASTAKGKQAILDAGAKDVFDHSEEEYLSALKNAYPEGFDVCLEMLASSNLGKDLPLMARSGRVVVVGSRGEVTINPRDIMSKELVVTAVMLMGSTERDLARYAAYLHAQLRKGQVLPLVEMVLPLSEAPLAHDEVIQRKKIVAGNIVLTTSHN